MLVERKASIFQVSRYGLKPLSTPRKITNGQKITFFLRISLYIINVLLVKKCYIISLILFVYLLIMLFTVSFDKWSIVPVTMSTLLALL